MMIKIYYCVSDSRDIPEELSEQRKNKITACRSERSRIEQIRSAKVLKAGLADLGLAEVNVIYRENENGKPYIEGHDDVRFSLSHTDCVSIVAFYQNEIGIDCENINKKISGSVTKRFFFGAEKSASEEQRLLLWVAKEAVVKQSSLGFIKGRKEVEIPYFEDELILDGLWLKRLEIGGALAVICAQKRDGISITEVM